MRTVRYTKWGLLIILFAFSVSSRVGAQSKDTLYLPDPLIAEAYYKAAHQNILAAVNPAVFNGYFSVCADGKGFGYGNSYPSLDGHQMSDALLWLGQINTVKANWDYVKSFQKPDGRLPLAILPANAGKKIGPQNYQAEVDPNGGLYQHWVPKDPLRALAGTTYIQNADVIFRFTSDKQWLTEQLPSINRTADYLASLISEEGAVGGAGYYVERPTRVEFDGVSQGHVVDAFRRLAALNKVVGNLVATQKYRVLADRVASFFQKKFWQGTQYAEYIHPEKGVVKGHGLTDVDWTALATGVASEKQKKVVWPQLKSAKGFYYKGMPTGIATKPATYESWETTYADNQDLAAMGRVWYLEAWARANMGDAEGLISSIRAVSQAGRDSSYYWRERYNANGGYGAKKYNEYPANLIRIVQRFLFGAEHGLDGSLQLSPVAPEAFWRSGFGQRLSLRNGAIYYMMKNGRTDGQYTGDTSQTLSIKFPYPVKNIRLVINGAPVAQRRKDKWITFVLPASKEGRPSTFSMRFDH
ncbi:alpha-L-rhamnosidase-related protein [Larkinella rosea]|uniref:Alpha-L-rhamnosidase six-hairpin glycosidase domain-containing protein n=1 Tax=Larkinella rosea TaxID=2025312 RepID=A0A3P1BAM7_9BACT|nr:hypothetical protein [Larkinella rosea]RRA98140.1 hypothetical protein EHT25_31225 [Larkinella rosea]